MPSGTVLIVDEDSTVRERASSLLRRDAYEPEVVENVQKALEKLESTPFDFLVTELKLSGMDGFQFISRAKEKRPEMIVIAVSASDKLDTALESIQVGAADYIPKPITRDTLIPALRKAQARERGQRPGSPQKPGVSKENEFASIIAKGPLMQEIFRTIQKIAEYKTTCLLLGESGTGKELVARAIHYNSSRAKEPFITVNCGAIPENLLESELFGHVKGSFTGAIRTKKGLFEEAHQGTLFLDEIGELPLLLQVKILRALQEEEIRRVGDVNPIKIDVRIIAATVKDLTKEVERGTFREDLFYRLHVLPIHLPPLRDRKEDIPILCGHFIQKNRKKMISKVETLDPKVMKIFMDYDWPGNVRELENTIERALVLSTGEKVTLEDLPANMRDIQRGGSIGGRVASDELSIKKMGRAMEEDLILKALQRARGNRTKAAKLLEISHRALLYKIKRYKLETQLRAMERSGG